MKHNFSKILDDNQKNTMFPTLQLQTKKVELNGQTVGGYLLAKINRPESLNALNSQVLSDLHQLLHFIGDSSVTELFQQKIQALVITGAGEKSFVAGADIKEMTGFAQSKNTSLGLSFADKGQQIFRQLETLPIPAIAAVNGFCLGGGLELALACDFIYASEKAKMGLPEVSLGLIPGFGGTVRLARVVGLNQAREMIFTGQMLNATEALQLGLVNKIFPPENLLDKVHETLIQILTKGPLAVANAKKSVLQSYDQNIDQGLKTESEIFGNLFAWNDTAEGLNAFLEKRKANFSGI